MSDIYPPYIQGLAEAGRLLVAACIGVLVVAVQRWTRRSGPLTRSMEQAHVLLCLAGALMMLARVQQDLTNLLTPPRLQ